jgi:preprotein translocase subunit YajC
MLISTAFAQAAGGGGGTGMGDILGQLVLFVPIIFIFYFIVIRPQQQRMKAHQAMVTALKRGDVVVMSGGVIGKIIKVLENDEVMVEIAEDVRVRVIKSTIAELRSKTEPVEAKSKNDDDGDKK